jgi:4-hydroxybenzoyl-CoA thioesterase/acyl-CoA thioester hydrolase
LSEFVLPLRVYIEDTDAGGIVYYVNYLKFIERARTELMRSLGYGKTAIFNQQAMFVVHSLDIKYKAPARLDDALEATAKVLKIGNAFILFEQSVRKGSQILCEGKVKIACVERDSMAPQVMPAEMKAALKGWQEQV